MTDDQKEIVRIEAFWIDTWLKSQYDGVTTRYVIHDAVAKEVDQHTFYHTRESGGTRISSAYNLANKIIDADHPPADWNVYVLHFSDGDNWGEDNRQCVGMLRDQLLPKCNLFGYGQVESPYGSGEFYRELEEAFEDVPNLALSEIRNKEGIFDSIKEFLGAWALMTTPRLSSGSRRTAWQVPRPLSEGTRAAAGPSSSRPLAQLARFGTCEGTPDAGTFRGSTPIGGFAGSYRSPAGVRRDRGRDRQEALARQHGDDRVRGAEVHRPGLNASRIDGATPDVDHEHRAQPARRPPRPPGGDRGARPLLRPRLLRHHLRGARLRRTLGDRRARGVPHPLPALAVRHGVRAALQGLSLRAPEDLRDGHQQRPLLRLPPAMQPAGRPEAGHGPRLRPQRLLQE